MFFSRKKLSPYLIDAGEFLELTEHVSLSHCRCHTALPYESTDKLSRMESLDFRDVRKVLLMSILVMLEALNNRGIDIPLKVAGMSIKPHGSHV